MKKICPMNGPEFGKKKFKMSVKNLVQNVGPKIGPNIWSKFWSKGFGPRDVVQNLWIHFGLALI